ncbi:hypothetical protein MYCTH_2123181 [Thermothelomyces thermophilus ATCC 42464]|uniref:Stc1 domain-containing protein n=1 Tax=Thermothelomyces thermophilus (strain ATCC 42464 / BCRC 31852 / DSM 1799) TaxID=573729 RepID=G2Q2T3_THET4|nr:uncharacterized protein MYCTH_2123181 [Thermothelomyces thermophilus ATCC 42464]AEO54300.1 hypothetical protein MYCTH_2123181 [Thermothelomyces thermophilus ATCC 42464]
MHFSVTKEVDWEADDESDGFTPTLGVKKRYRLVLDFSRRSSKHRKEGKGIDVEPSENIDHPISYRHRCYGCNAPRSDQYQQEFPPRRGRKPRPSLCTRCRYYREIRVADRARRSRGRRRTDKLTARIDEREWCAGCGTLRSNKYHSKLLSGELSVWDEICGQCIINKERRDKRGRLGTCYKGQRVVGCSEEEDDQNGFPGHSNPQDCRSSPYAFTPTSFRDEMKLVLGTASTLDNRAGPENSKVSPSCNNEQSAIKAASRADARRDPVNVGKVSEHQRANIRCYASKSEASKHGQDQGAPARQGGKGGSRREGSQQQNTCRESSEKSTGQPRLRGVRLTAGKSPSWQSPKSYELCVRQREPKDAEKGRLPAASSIVGGTSRSGEKEEKEKAEEEVEGREARDYFKPPHLEDWYNKHRQPMAKSRSEERHGAPNVASFPAGYQELQEGRDYFKLPQQQQQQQQQQKRCATRWRRTAADSKIQEEAGERHSDGHGHRKHPSTSTSSTRSSRSQPQEPFYFNLHSRDGSQPKPAASTDRHLTDRNSQARRKAQPAPPRRQQQQQQQKKQRQPGSQPRPMGVSDLYWASEYGQAERASTGAGGGFFLFSDARASGISTTTTTAAAAVSPSETGASPPPRSADQKQIWEVDSDEADEIERAHARLVAALGRAAAGARGC